MKINATISLSQYLERSIVAIQKQHFVFSLFQMVRRLREERIHAFVILDIMYQIKHFKDLKVMLLRQGTEIIRVSVVLEVVQAVIKMVFVIQKKLMRLGQWKYY